MNIQYLEWLQLLRRRLANGMVSLVPAGSLLRRKAQVVTAGFFGVPKSAGSVGLFIDRRCQNKFEVGLLEALQRLDTPQLEFFECLG